MGINDVDKAHIAKLLAAKEGVSKVSTQASNKLRDLVKSSPGAMGMPSEELRKSDEYKKASAHASSSFQAERKYNSSPEGKKAIAERNKLSIVERQKMRQANNQ